MKIGIAGENALMIHFGNRIDPVIATQVQQATHLLESSLGDALVDLVPSYASLLVIYDPARTTPQKLRLHIKTLLAEAPTTPQITATTIELPVYYSIESGPDLQRIAHHHSLGIEEVIRLHSCGEYRVYALGFAPGFAYLGEVDKRIAMARHPTPRLQVAKGAVAIADRQTAVYPAVSPGGWNLIGLCPIPVFDATQNPPTPFNVGDTVRFNPVSRDEFLSLGGQL